MPEEKKTVDIDTSGPEVDVQLPEEKQEEINETTVQNDSESVDTSKKSDVSADVQESKQEETKEEKSEAEVKTETTQEKDELKEYSESVQKRISWFKTITKKRSYKRKR